MIPFIIRHPAKKIEIVDFFDGYKGNWDFEFTIEMLFFSNFEIIANSFPIFNSFEIFFAEKL